jgi:DNA mismatch repair ATPase MutS
MYMHINAATFSALHIFATEHHPLIAKGQGHSKEGWSLFSLLDRNRSRGGRQLLREWMLKPLIDLQAIVARQDAVELFTRVNLQTSVGVLLNLLGKIGPVDKILTRMQKCSTQPSDFLVLTKTLSAAVAISSALRNEILPMLEGHNGQTIQGHPVLNSIFQRCNAPVLLELQERITMIVDEEATNDSKSSVVIRNGFNDELDEWKDHYEHLEGE